MKILLIDVVMYGHHLPYFEAMMDGLKAEHQVIGIVPDEYQNAHYDLRNATLYKKNKTAKDVDPLGYIRWMFKVAQIARREKPDIVHFLYGDIMYRYFGIGLELFRGTKVIVTLHQVRRSRIRDFSIKQICSKATWNVVHTNKLANDLKGMRLQNIRKVEYPCFAPHENVYRRDAQKQMGFDAGDKPVLLALGGTRYEKGLDILLEALKNVDAPFYLLVAGYPELYDERYVAENSKEYKEQVYCILKYLSDEEFSLSLAACDFVVLPYRRVFDGASGPLGEGVARNKVIIGPDHGSLGKIITENHLGYIFETENVHSLARTIQKALAERFEKDEKYRNYQREISPEKFVENYLKIYEEDRT